MSVYRFVWAVGAVGLGVTGATLALLALTPGLVVLAVAVGLLAGGLIGMASGGDETPKPQRQLPAAAAGFTLVIVGAGLGAVAGPLGPAAAVLMVAASPVALRWYPQLRLPEPDPTPLESAASTGTPPAGVPMPRNPTPGNRTSSLGPMTDQQLCSGWRRSCVALRRATRSADRLAIVEERAAYLDELQRRDPVGFACWMAAGRLAASDPARYLGNHLS